MSVELTENLLTNAAGWEATKRARAYLEQGQVASSHWAAPLLRGVVQTGEMSLRASMVINGPIDIENLCSCREAREWGKICAHSIAVGLHWLRAQKLAAAAAADKGPPSRGGGANPRAQSKTPALLRDPSGEAAELFIIFPPNLEQALARGKLMLVFEAKWSGGRTPLNAMPRGRAFAFSDADTAIIDRLEELAQGDTPAVLQVDAKQLASLLPLLVDHENVTLGKSQEVRVPRETFRLSMRATLEADGQIRVALADKAASFLRIENWIWNGTDFRPLDLPPVLAGILCEPVRISRPQVPQFLSNDWPRLMAAGALEANFRLADFKLEPRAPTFLLELKGGLARLNALLQCAYGPRIMTVGVTAPDETLWLPDTNDKTAYSTRDLTAERAALGRLQRSGFSGPDSEGRLDLAGQNAVLNFLAREFPKLQREWKVTLEERLERSAAEKIERIEPQFQVTPSGIQWFDLGVVYASSGGETFAPADIQRLLLSGQSHTRLKNGKIAVIDTGAVEELQEVLLDCSPQQQGNAYRINNVQGGFLEATLRQAQWKLNAPAEWRQKVAGERGETRRVCPPLGELENVLRPYQKEGVAWLAFLREHGFGGILADEMGLGKTLQTLALFNTRTATAPGTRKPVLIVCPTSLVFNWLAEAKKFTPNLRVLALHGPDRQSSFHQIAASDLVITSYALIRRDAEFYAGLEFDTVVLDEAQHIKNRLTQNAQAVKAVKASHRLVLTGTPMENSVLDLWSIFDFLMPGYLGSAQDFRERYEVPITRDKSVEAQSRLARRLRPFMLRRLKSEVATDLPPKLEQVAFCELTPDQRGAYQQVLEAGRKEILQTDEAPGGARTRMLVLTTLLRLRQICCDLRLLKLEGVNPANASGKLELFGELLEEAIDGGHRLLVFSQFVSMLALLKEKLTADSVDFCCLDGSTSDRAAVVQKFQTNASIPVFLISLKAGGVGLNLTAADTVIHFDPWWNPAVEAQATDRTHRIGQTRVVTSYKLITRDTIEEKILALQNRKKEVIQATIGGEEEFAASLSWEEIQELLA